MTIKNTQRQELLTRDQELLVAELVATYDIEREQIIFFTGDPKPFFHHEASAVLVRALAGAVGIENEPVPSIFDDAVSIKNRITFADGSFSSAIGIANLGETENGRALSPEQIQRLATSRATRGTLVNAGVDLVKLHHQRMQRTPANTPQKSNNARLHARAHLDGRDAGLIDGEDKTLWYKALNNRYGVLSSTELSDELLADWAAFVSSLVPQNRQKAA